MTRFLLCLLLLPGIAGATNRTVKAGGGGDFTTIQACSTASAAGDSCTVFAGTYNENVTVSSGTVGNYKTMTVNGSDTVNVYSFTIGSHNKIIGFHIHHDAAPTNAPCITVNSGGTTDYFITNNVMSACGVYMIKEDSASNTTHGFIQGNTLSYSCSTSASPNTCTAMQISGDYHLIEDNDISHVSDGPYVTGKHNVLRNNTFHDVTDTDCGSNSGNCHVDMLQADANVAGGAQPAAYLLVENNTVSNWVNTGTFAGAGMHAGALLQAEACNGLCQNAIFRFNTAAHNYGGGTTNDNSGTNPPPQAWINVKSYNNDWLDMLVGITGAGNGVNGHDHGSFGWAHINEIYQLPFASANQTNPYYCVNTASACSPSAYGNNLAFCTGGNCSAQLFGHTYGSGAFTADPGNVYGDPLFVNYSGGNFALQPTSPALNTGTYLTTVASGDTHTGTSLIVNDAGFFQDGSGIAGVSGDCVAVTTVTNPICVTSINYTTNTLTLASAITRASGDHIWLYSDSSGRRMLSATGVNMGSSAPSTPSPTTRYVTTTGSDSNPCTLAFPCATPTHAAAISFPGDTVNVGSGTYSYGASAAVFATAGTSGNPITITCATRGSCKITNTVGPGNATVVDMQAQYNVLDGFEITNTNPSGNNLGVFVEASNVSLTRNTIHDIRTDCSSSGGGGIQVYTNNYTNIVLDSNQVYNINWASGAPTCPNSVVQSDGIISEQTGFTTNTIISNNLIYNVSGGWCISTSTNAQVVNNTMFNCVNGGIVFNNAPSGALASNNIIVYTGLLASNGLRYGGACAIQNGTASTTTYGFNELAGNRDGSGNTHANYGTGFGCNTSTTNPGDILVDPAGGTVFVNWQQNGSGDYREKAGSPTIAAATATGAPNHDYDGNVRPSGGGYDIGAYQSGITWYIRGDGGTRQQCTGTNDTPYPGSGTGQSCAFNDFRYMWSPNDGTGGAGAWIMAGGDTVIIRSCQALGSQENPSNPACRLGYDSSTNGNPPNAWCPNVGNNGCFNPPIPAGTASQHTRILGSCVLAGNCNSGNTTNKSNLTQLFGGMGLTWTFNLGSTQYVDIQGIYLTTHNKVNTGTFAGQNCTHGGSPGYPTPCSTSYPLDDYADNGFLTNNTTSNILFQDVIVDGFASSGFWGPIGGPITLTRVQSNFNAGDGWNFDDGHDTADAAGSQIIASYLTMNGNGCYEEYPIVHAFPARACYDSGSAGGGGDTFSGQDTTLDVLTCDHCTFAYNTKDAYIGPHTQIKTHTITNSFSYGNMGANWKWGSTTNGTVLFQNNLTVGNCLRMDDVVPGASQTFNRSSGLGGAYLSTYCRAGGAQFAVITRSGSSNQYIGNTIIGASNIIFQSNCGFYSPGNVFNQETNCGSVPNLYKDNNFLGYNDPGIGDFPALYFAETPSIHFTGSFNNEFGIKGGTGDTCGSNNITCVSPLLNSQPASPWPGSEGSLDVFNAYAGLGNSFYPTSTSPLRAAGVSLPGFTTDFYGLTRTSPPDLGGVIVPGSSPTIISIAVTPNPGTLLVASTLAMTCTATLSNFSTTLCPTPVWSTTAAHTTIDPSSGIVTGVSAGSDTITARSSGFTANATINVSSLPIVANPTASPLPGSYTSPQTITLSDTTSAAVICWRSDGPNPTASTPGVCDAGSNTYSAPFILSTSGTILAIGTKAGSTNSGIASFAYTIAGTPIYTVNGTLTVTGTYTAPP